MKKLLILLSLISASGLPARAESPAEKEMAAFQMFAIEFANTAFVDPQRHAQMYTENIKFNQNPSSRGQMLAKYVEKSALLKSRGISNPSDYIKYPVELFTFNRKGDEFYAIYPYVASEAGSSSKGSVGIMAKRSGDSFEVLTENRPINTVRKAPITSESPNVKALREASIARHALWSTSTIDIEQSNRDFAAILQAGLAEWRASQNPALMEEIALAMWQEWLRSQPSQNGHPAPFVAKLLADNLGDAKPAFFAALKNISIKELNGVFIAGILNAGGSQTAPQAVADAEPAAQMPVAQAPTARQMAAQPPDQPSGPQPQAAAPRQSGPTAAGAQFANHPEVSIPMDFSIVPDLHIGDDAAKLLPFVKKYPPKSGSIPDSVTNQQTEDCVGEELIKEITALQVVAGTPNSPYATEKERLALGRCIVKLNYNSIPGSLGFQNGRVDIRFHWDQSRKRLSITDIDVFGVLGENDNVNAFERQFGEPAVINWLDKGAFADLSNGMVLTYEPDRIDIGDRYLSVIHTQLYNRIFTDRLRSESSKALGLKHKPYDRIPADSISWAQFERGLNMSLCGLKVGITARDLLSSPLNAVKSRWGVSWQVGNRDNLQKYINEIRTITDAKGYDKIREVTGFAIVDFAPGGPQLMGYPVDQIELAFGTDYALHECFVTGISAQVSLPEGANTDAVIPQVIAQLTPKLGEPSIVKDQSVQWGEFSVSLSYNRLTFSTGSARFAQSIKTRNKAFEKQTTPSLKVRAGAIE